MNDDRRQLDINKQNTSQRFYKKLGEFQWNSGFARFSRWEQEIPDFPGDLKTVNAVFDRIRREKEGEAEIG